ncbi:hypothetical protein [Wenzhouxiangella sp. EGI_FJ10409]|uniref:hypothetical protein n=1 Tax=Wenzhouxiangella sp. EGI_FJ10409 TaxID=3243767 RepID=UPI0035DA35CD
MKTQRREDAKKTWNKQKAENTENNGKGRMNMLIEINTKGCAALDPFSLASFCFSEFGGSAFY